MAKRSKSFRRHASGGNPRFSTLDAGLTAMRQQSDTQVRQLEKLSGQRERQDNIFINALEGKLSREANNRKELYEIEEVTPRKMRGDALETNNQRLQERFKQKIKEQEDLATTWGELAPSLAKAGAELWSASRGFLDTRAASDDYEDLIQSGYLNNLSKFHDAQDKEANKLQSQAINLLTKKAQHYLKTGDLASKKEHDVLLYQLKTTNPKLRDLKVADIKANLDIMIRDMISMIEDPRSGNPIKVDHKNIAQLIQFRGIEVCRQLGISPKSKSGLEIQKAFRTKGLEYQQQYTLGYEYNRDSAVVNGQPDLIKVSHQNNDYEGANNNWKIMFSTYLTLPVESRSGEWSPPVNVNPIESFKDLLKEQMYNPRYANNYTLFAEEMYGKNAANEYGYVIVNPEGDPNKKHNRLLGKHPNLENEMLVEWNRIHNATKAAEKKSIEAKYAADAAPFIEKVNSGYYRKPENQGKLWKDFKQYQNNPVALVTLGRSLAFSDETIDKGLLNSHLFRDMRAGITSSTVDAWFTAPEGDQNITWARDNFGELADALGYDLNKLDNEILKETKALLDSIVVNNSLAGGRKQHFSTEFIDREMASFLVNYYIKNRNQNETAKETWREANAELKAMLGFGEKVSDAGIAGYGQFAHRPKGMKGDNRVVFLSKVGDVYNNTSSGEIQAMLDGDFTLPFEPGKEIEEKISYLINAVAIEAQDDFTDEDLLRVFSSKRHKANHPLLRQIFPHLKKLNITEYDFLNSIGIIRSGKEGNELFCEMTGKDWCDNTNGTLHIKDPNDKLMVAAFDRYKKQMGLEPWEAAMLGSSNLKVIDYITKKLKLDQGETDD